MGHRTGLGHGAYGRLAFKLPTAAACPLKPFYSWVFFLFVLWGFSAFSTAAGAETIADYWNRVYGAETVQPAPTPAPVPQTAAATPVGMPTGGGLGDVRDYVTFRYGIDYTHNLATFTDHPTRTFVVD